jgi:hypothetical protein
MNGQPWFLPSMLWRAILVSMVHLPKMLSFFGALTQSVGTVPFVFFTE